MGKGDPHAEWLSPAEMGARSELIACRALQQAGYEIVARNYRTPRFEIDIIARQHGYIVFVEVRARRAGGIVHPLESITQRKRHRIILGAQHYLHTHRMKTPRVRFDVVSVEWRGRWYRLRIFPDAF